MNLSRYISESEIILRITLRGWHAFIVSHSHSQTFKLQSFQTILEERYQISYLKRMGLKNALSYILLEMSLQYRLYCKYTYDIYFVFAVI